MSYCRWSSMDYLCDVYCYEHVDGYFAVHVAENRPVYKTELPPQVDYAKDPEGWMKRHHEVMNMLDEADREPIGLPYDGQDHQFSTSEEAAYFLEELRSVGYNVPDTAITALHEEAKNPGDTEKEGAIST